MRNNTAGPGRRIRYSGDRYGEHKGVAVKSIALSTILILALAGAAVAETGMGIEAFKRGQYANALKELAEPAEEGDPEALYFLGRMHETGLGVEKDSAKAADFYRRGAQANHAAAQYEYGNLLVLGEGVKQDIPEALKWMYIAAQQGHEGAKDSTGRFAKFLGRRQVLEARIAASAWRRAQRTETESQTRRNGSAN